MHLYAVHRKTKEHVYFDACNPPQQFPLSDWIGKSCDEEGWIDWEDPGYDVCPVMKGSFCEVMLEDGNTFKDHEPEVWNWHEDEIIKYRPVSAP